MATSEGKTGDLGPALPETGGEHRLVKSITLASDPVVLTRHIGKASLEPNGTCRCSANWPQRSLFQTMSLGGSLLVCVYWCRSLLDRCSQRKYIIEHTVYALNVFLFARDTDGS